MSGAQGMTWAYENQNGVIRANRSYTNTLRVFTDSPSVGPIQILNALVGIGAVQGSYYQFPLPEYNTPGTGLLSFPAGITEQDTGSFAHEIDIRQETDDARQWLCTISYGPVDLIHEVGDPASGVINPILAAPKVKWVPNVKEVSYPSDVNGAPYTNNVGDPLENPPKREVSEQTLSFTRNEATYNEVWAKQYRQSVNLNTFLGFAPKQAKCKMISGEQIYQADYGYYWEVNYEFEFRIIDIKQPNTYDPLTQELDNSSGHSTVFGWEELVLNAGFRQIDSNGKLAQILVNGIPVTSPVAIDRNGKVANVVTDPGTPSPPPYYLVYDQYPQMDFDFLNIPDDTLTRNQ